MKMAAIMMNCGILLIAAKDDKRAANSINSLLGKLFTPAIRCGTVRVKDCDTDTYHETR